MTYIMYTHVEVMKKIVEVIHKDCKNNCNQQNKQSQSFDYCEEGKI